VKEALWFSARLRLGPETNNRACGRFIAGVVSPSSGDGRKHCTGRPISANPSHCLHFPFAVHALPVIPSEDMCGVMPADVHLTQR
jgi:hypothetical protein